MKMVFFSFSFLQSGSASGITSRKICKNSANTDIIKCSLCVEKGENLMNSYHHIVKLSLFNVYIKLHELCCFQLLELFI